MNHRTTAKTYQKNEVNKSDEISWPFNLSMLLVAFFSRLRINYIIATCLLLSELIENKFKSLYG